MEPVSTPAAASTSPGTSTFAAAITIEADDEHITSPRVLTDGYNCPWEDVIINVPALLGKTARDALNEALENCAPIIDIVCACASKGCRWRGKVRVKNLCPECLDHGTLIEEGMTNNLTVDDLMRTVHTTRSERRVPKVRQRRVLRVLGPTCSSP